ncbi:hypothetical protein SAMN06297144_1209 [Sphingomonas guangdongensis]|uniref:Uncharacterized protein n=1 Tax=Sphingomonas guangdongensis TaxID=1141890 RepID=A0A285QKZ0_9SPHN|nr:hypothetical protein [Sphingomonas guangdongensis]SOB80732.1 hypothetical protein SAMN06297144_1209 [Sphingomonas guangdongensis]
MIQPAGLPPGTVESIVEVVGFVKAASATVIVATIGFALKNWWEFVKLREDRRKRAEDLQYRRDEEDARRKEAVVAAKRGLTELERHMWENSLVMRAMSEELKKSERLPLEYQVRKFSLLPLPDFLTDRELARLEPKPASVLTKLQKMVPNFEREFEQAEKAVVERDLETFRTMLRTLSIKASVGMNKARQFHKDAFGDELIEHEERSPAGTLKPVDYYDPIPRQAAGDHAGGLLAKWLKGDRRGK